MPDEIVMSISMIAKYPFLQQASEYVRNCGITIEQLISDPALAAARRRGKERVVQAIENSAIIPPSIPITDTGCTVELLSYPVARILVSLCNMPSLIRRYALAEAKSVDMILQNERPGFIIEVGKQLGLSSTNGERDKLIIHFSDFLYYSSGIRAPEWKLVNQSLNSGMVILSKDRVIRLIQSAIQNRIEDELPLETTPEIISVFKTDVTELRRMWDAKYKQYKAMDTGPISLVHLPPCMKRLLAMAQAGENIPHQGRFSLTAFLHALGLSSDEIIKVFSQSPDFDPTKSKYQIDHITGAISGTEYTPPECSTMRTYGICIESEMDELCRSDKLKHPLNYYRIRKRGRKLGK